MSSTDALSSDCQPVQQLQSLCEGLHWPSEADYPVEVVHWTEVCHPLTEADLLKQAGHGAETAIERISLEQLFKTVARMQDWFGEAERARAARFQQLQQYLDTLENPQVFRVGEVEVVIYALGQLQDSSPLGIRTQVVET